jgi:hypothetical protein
MQSSWQHANPETAAKYTNRVKLAKLAAQEKFLEASNFKLAVA